MEQQLQLSVPVALPHSESTGTLNEPPLNVMASTTMDYNTTETRCPFFIAIAGGSASGKKQVCQMIVDTLKSREARRVLVIKLEDFTRELTEGERHQFNRGEYNFDHPDAMDFRLLESCLVELAAGNAFPLPSWDFQNKIRRPSTETAVPHDIVIFEGNLILYKKRVREFFDLRVFVDVDSDLRLSNQVIRDTETRYKKDLETVLHEYLTFVKPAFEDFVFPTKKFADVIIPRGAQNTVAIELLSKHIGDILKERGLQDDAMSASTTSFASMSLHSQFVAAATSVTEGGEEDADKFIHIHS